MTEGEEPDEGEGAYASPPCFMHELDPAYLGLPPRPDAVQRRDVARWRKAERQRLIAERLAVDVQTRRGHAERIALALEALLGDVTGAIVSLYWPFRGEPDLRSLREAILARGGACALPVAAERHAPLVFRMWRDGARMARDAWEVPVPADGIEVAPDIVIAPLVGFDRACYRLGYGAGSFDRTLAALGRRARAVGVGYAQAAIPTIYPQPHDIPMQAIVTERETLRSPPAAGGG